MIQNIPLTIKPLEMSNTRVQIEGYRYKTTTPKTNAQQNK